MSVQIVNPATAPTVTYTPIALGKFLYQVTWTAEGTGTTSISLVGGSVPGAIFTTLCQGSYTNTTVGAFGSFTVTSLGQTMNFAPRCPGATTGSIAIQVWN
jgi:hypothetical protein